jgi:hypothetical protein
MTPLAAASPQSPDPAPAAGAGAAATPGVPARDTRTARSAGKSPPTDAPAPVAAAAGTPVAAATAAAPRDSSAPAAPSPPPRHGPADPGRSLAASPHGVYRCCNLLHAVDPRVADDRQGAHKDGSVAFRPADQEEQAPPRREGLGPPDCAPEPYQLPPPVARTGPLLKAKGAGSSVLCRVHTAQGAAATHGHPTRVGCSDCSNPVLQCVGLKLRHGPPQPHTWGREVERSPPLRFQVLLRRQGRNARQVPLR